MTLNWQALLAAASFYTLGRCWAWMRGQGFSGCDLLAVSVMLAVAWPIIAFTYALDLAGERWPRLGRAWAELWRDEP